MNTVIIRIDGNVQWRVTKDPETETWIGVCDRLNLVAHGDTFSEMQICANEAMGALFLDLFEDNELVEFLRQHGWSIVQTLPHPGRKVTFDMPSEWARPLTTAEEILQPA